MGWKRWFATYCFAYMVLTIHMTNRWVSISEDPAEGSPGGMNDEAVPQRTNTPSAAALNDRFRRNPDSLCSIDSIPPRSFQPAQWLGIKKTNAELIIAVPTIVRPIRSYLVRTLRGLFNVLPSKYHDRVAVWVFVAHSEQEKADFIIRNIRRKFSGQLRSGLLQIIVPPSEFYGRFAISNCTGATQSCNFVKWKNKQNVDYAFMMFHGSRAANFYFQLEDDITCSENLFDAIFGEMKKFSTTPWLMKEASEDGFIGKLFSSKETCELSRYLIENYDTDAVDWLLPKFLKKRGHDYPPGSVGGLGAVPLCSHDGTISSLAGKFYVERKVSATSPLR